VLFHLSHCQLMGDKLRSCCHFGAHASTDASPQAGLVPP
jgi:hypothetical protein